MSNQVQGQQTPEGFRWADAPRFKSSRGKQIISAVLLDHGLHPDDFFGYARDQHLIKARRECAERLSAAGYNASEIARMMKRNHTTILNYFPKLRDAKNGRYLKNRLLEFLPPDIREIVQAYAKAEGVSIAVLIAQWVGERATYEAQAKIEADALTRAEASKRAGTRSSSVWSRTASSWRCGRRASIRARSPAISAAPSTRSPTVSFTFGRWHDRSVQLSPRAIGRPGYVA